MPAYDDNPFDTAQGVGGPDTPPAASRQPQPTSQIDPEYPFGVNEDIPDEGSPRSEPDRSTRSEGSEQPSYETPSRTPEPIAMPGAAAPPQQGPGIYDVFGNQQGPGGPAPPSPEQIFQAQMRSLPVPMQAQLMHDMVKLSMGEQIRKQRLEQGMAWVDAQSDLLPEEKLAMKAQMNGHLNQFKIREMKAHALQQEMATKQMEENVTRQHALGSALDAQSKKFASLSAQSPDGTFTLPGHEGRYFIDHRGDVAEVPNKGAAVIKEQHAVEKEAHKEWNDTLKSAHAHAQKEVAAKDKMYSVPAGASPTDIKSWKERRDDEYQKSVQGFMKDMGMPSTKEEFLQSRLPPKSAGGQAPPAGQPATIPEVVHKPFDPEKPETMHPLQKQAIDDLQKARQLVVRSNASDAHKSAVREDLDGAMKLLALRGSVQNMNEDEKRQYRTALRSLEAFTPEANAARTRRQEVNR